jgi:hypothetical protein
MSQRAVYDPATKSYRGTTSKANIMPASSKIKGYDSPFMNGSPFGPFNAEQVVDGSPYREPRYAKKK